MRVTRFSGALLAVYLLTGPLVSSCAHPPPTITTPQGQRAFRADQIVVRVNELQRTAIQAEANGGLSTAATRTIVQFAVSADTVLKDTPAGWQTTVTTLWAEAKRQIPATTNQALVAAIGAVDVAIASLQP